MYKIVHKILDITSKPPYFECSTNPTNPEAFRGNRHEFICSKTEGLTSKGRVEYVLKYYNLRLTDEKGKNKFSKNSTVAKQLREIGNEFYRKKEFAKALEFYNVAIMFASGVDSELGLAYANRSIVLMELGHPDEALADIDLALLNNYPKPPVLEKRRRKCSKRVDQKNKIRDDEEVRVRAEKEISERQKMREEMIRIENPNPRIPEAADFVTIEYDEVMGRKLVVTKDVPAATVLMVSRPYATVVDNAEGWNSKRCHQCLRRIRRGIPCENCVSEFYCNETCKKEAHEEYHKFECSCMHYVHWLHPYLAIAFRTVCKAGPKKLFELFGSQDRSYFNPKEPYGIEQDCKFDKDPYLAVYHMVNHIDKSSEAEDENYAKTCSSIALALMLETRSTFFHKIPNDRRTEFIKFVATLIRHHIDSAQMNPTSVFEMQGLEGTSLEDFYTEGSGCEDLSRKIKSSRPVKFALGMYPLDSLLNHSCDPNVYCVDDVSNGRKITVASRALKAGDVLYGSYGVVFKNHPLWYRQETLRKNYYFTCGCIACVNKWPTSTAVTPADMARLSRFCCPTCFIKSTAEEKASAEFQNKCELSEAGSWKCNSCDKQYSKEALKGLLDANLMVVEEAEKLIQRNRLRKAIATLPEAVEFCQTYLCPPSHLQITAESYSYHAMCLLFHYLGL